MNLILLFNPYASTSEEAPENQLITKDISIKNKII